MITKEQFESYLAAKGAIEDKALQVAEILNEVDKDRYPLYKAWREVEIDEDEIFIRSETGHSYDDPEGFSFKLDLLYKSNEEIKAQAISERDERLRVLKEKQAEARRISEAELEAKERAQYEALKVKYENK